MQTVLALCTAVGQSHQDVQIIRLEPGWNLIAFQTRPANPDPNAVFDTNLFSTVMTYDNATRVWSHFGRTPPASPEHNLLRPMASVELGRAYWVFFDRPTATNWQIVGFTLAQAVKLDFRQGWNLVGIPGQSDGTDLNILSIFKPGDLEKIQFIARWQASLQKFELYDSRNAAASQFQFFNPNLGHWIAATEEFSVQPDMVVEASGDGDMLPLHDPAVVEGSPWSPGPEDISIHLPGQVPVFQTRATKAVLKIPIGQDSYLLPLYNRGGGLLGWTATFLPRASQGGATGLDAAALSSVLALEQTSGVTSSETDTLKIFVHRSRLAPGTYLARLHVAASTGQERTFDLVVDVGGLDGQWEGRATIHSVNGKANPVADIDLFLHLFQDNKPGSKQLRGIIDSRETLLWPMDAQLLGHVIDSPPGTFDPNYASRFVISGGYTMPPGDVNRHPFETFPTFGTPVIDPDTGLPFLTNPEGDRWYHTLPDRLARPNFLNPYPTFISREVELIGQLTGSEGGAAVAEGDYYETIRGMMPRPIFLRGNFRLVRKSHSPSEKRPYKYFDENIPLGGVQVAAGGSVTRTNSISGRILIKRLLVVVAQEADSDKHQLELIGPNDQTVILHNGQNVGSTRSVIYDSGDLPIDPLRLLDPPDLRGPNAPKVADRGNLVYENALRESLAQYSVRRPRGAPPALNAFAGMDALGQWRLKYVNTDSTVRRLRGWSLLVYGAPAYPISGQVIVEGSADPNRFQDVAVRVLGLNADLDTGLLEFNRATGQFSMPSLPGLRVNVVAYKPGYRPGTIEGLNTPADPRGFRDGLGGVLIGGPGTADVTLTLRLPPPQTTPQVFTHQRAFHVTGANGVAPLTGATLALLSPTPDTDIGWELEWQGVTPPPVNWTATGTRAPTISFDIPLSAFTSANNFTVAYRARAYRISDGQTLAHGEWVVVTLGNPSPPANVNPYWSVVLVQGTMLQGFGAVSESVTDAVDKTGITALHAQKTDVTIVDVDRPPLINPQTNPSFLFDADGFSGNADGEDTDLHPRTFTRWMPGSQNNEYAYAEIQPVSDFRFAPLAPALPEQTPTYDDVDNGISGRDISKPGEPVRIFTALGGRFANLSVSGTDGRFRISAAANPGVDQR
jgi:hypothetical protein